MKRPARALPLLLAAFVLHPSSFLLLPTPSAAAALDFTLQHKLMAADGIALDEVYVTDGDSKIFLRFPPNWQVFNSAQALDFEPNVSGAKVRLERFSDTRILTIDDAGGRDLRQRVEAQLPKDAKNVAALPVELNPLPIFEWKTLEVAFRYEYYGQTLRRTVMYLNMLPGRAVQMTVIGPDADFDKLHKQARQLLSSWFEPSRDLPPSVQRKYEAPLVPGS